MDFLKSLIVLASLHAYCFQMAPERHKYIFFFKIVPPGIIAELKERQALQLCDGDSTIKLLGYDETLGTIMLERARPGVPLSVNTDDEENTRIASRLMKKFWKPLPPKNLEISRRRKHFFFTIVVIPAIHPITWVMYTPIKNNIIKLNSADVSIE